MPVLHLFSKQTLTEHSLCASSGNVNSEKMCLLPAACALSSAGNGKAGAMSRTQTTARFCSALELRKLFTFLSIFFFFFKNTWQRPCMTYKTIKYRLSGLLRNTFADPRLVGKCVGVMTSAARSIGVCGASVLPPPGRHESLCFR